jgi:hypothetical protein
MLHSLEWQPLIVTFFRAEMVVHPMEDKSATLMTEEMCSQSTRVLYDKPFCQAPRINQYTFSFALAPTRLAPFAGIVAPFAGLYTCCWLIEPMSH